MNEYTLFWLDGFTNTVTGADIADAMNRAGYGQGALRALDFYAAGDAISKYAWNGKRWENLEIKKLMEVGK